MCVQQIKGYQRRSEDMAMKVLSDHFYVAVHDMKPVTTCIQPCRCYVCSLVQIMVRTTHTHARTRTHPV